MLLDNLATNDSNTTATPAFDLNPAIYVFSPNKTAQPITSPTFFTCFRLTPRTNISLTPASTVTTDFTMEPLMPIPPAYASAAAAAGGTNPRVAEAPEIITRIAKLFYSLLLADLGQDKHTSTITTDPALLGEYMDYAIKETDPDTEPNWEISNFWRNATSVMKLGDDSTIYTQYTCQVPRQRVTGSVVIAVMVSDLVLLQALWAVFTWATMWWMQRAKGGRESDVMYCVGCADDKQRWGARRTLTGVTVTELGGSGSSSDEEKRIGG